MGSAFSGTQTPQHVYGWCDVFGEQMVTLQLAPNSAASAGNGGSFPKGSGPPYVVALAALAILSMLSFYFSNHCSFILLLYRL